MHVNRVNASLEQYGIFTAYFIGLPSSCDVYEAPSKRGERRELVTVGCKSVVYQGWLIGPLDCTHNYIHHCNDKWHRKEATRGAFAPSGLEYKFNYIIFKLILLIDGWSISHEISPRYISLDVINDTSTMFHLIAWCSQATSHYLISVLTHVDIAIVTSPGYNPLISWNRFQQDD